MFSVRDAPRLSAATERSLISATARNDLWTCYGFLVT
jgi:hypothetical protein